MTSTSPALFVYRKSHDTLDRHLRPSDNSTTNAQPYTNLFFFLTAAATCPPVTVVSASTASPLVVAVWPVVSTTTVPTSTSTTLVTSVRSVCGTSTRPSRSSGSPPSTSTRYVNEIERAGPYRGEGNCLGERERQEWGSVHLVWCSETTTMTRRSLEIGCDTQLGGQRNGPASWIQANSEQSR